MPWFSSSTPLDNVSGTRLHWPFSILYNKLKALQSDRPSCETGRRLRVIKNPGQGRMVCHYLKSSPLSTLLPCTLSLLQNNAFQPLAKTSKRMQLHSPLAQSLDKHSSKSYITSISLHSKVSTKVRGSQFWSSLKIFKGFKGVLTFGRPFPPSTFFLQSVKRCSLLRKM